MKWPDNIEELLVDYAEGNLSSDKLLIVEKWLAEHPEDLDLLMNWNDNFGLSEADFEVDADFSSLFVDKELNAEEMMILEVEGLLPEKKKKVLDEACLISKPLAIEREIFSLSKLDYERDAIVIDKSTLKKKGLIIPFRVNSWAPYVAAASLLIFILSILPQEPNAVYKIRGSASPKIVQFEAEALPLFAASEPRQTESMSTSIPLEPITQVTTHSKLRSFPRMKHRTAVQIETPAISRTLSYQNFVIKTTPVGANQVKQFVAKSKTYDGVFAFVQDKVLQKLPFDLKGKNIEQILSSEIPKASDGKFALDIQNGRLLAVKTPVIEWKRK